MWNKIGLLFIQMQTLSLVERIFWYWLQCYTIKIIGDQLPMKVLLIQMITLITKTIIWICGRLRVSRYCEANYWDAATRSQTFVFLALVVYYGFLFFFSEVFSCLCSRHILYKFWYITSLPVILKPSLFIYLISVCSISCAGQTGDGRTSLNEKFGY